MADPSTYSAIGTGVSSIGQLVSGFSQSSADNSNAKIAKKQGNIVREQGQQQAAQIQRSATRLRGAQVAANGASGFTSNGSIWDVMQDSSHEAELDAMNAIYNSNNEAAGYDSKAATLKRSASDDIYSGISSAGATALKGYGKFQYLDALQKSGKTFNPNYDPYG